MDTLGPGISQDILKNLENDKCTLQDLEYCEKTEKHGKWEDHTVGPGIW